MSDNLTLWNKVDDIDPKFTKKITGRQYQGTSPNPQELIRMATEQFGPVGKGFGWEIITEEFTPLGDTVLHWCRIKFWWREKDEDHCFQEYGQTKAMYPTRNGILVDEDAPKKSLTDAVVKALSHLGFAANIFLGRWDDQKYVAEVAAEYREAERTVIHRPDGSQALNADFAHEPEPKVPQHDRDQQTRTLIGGACSLDALEIAKGQVREMWGGKVQRWVADAFAEREKQIRDDNKELA